MKELHEKVGIVHGDLKLGNLLIDSHSDIYKVKKLRKEYREILPRQFTDCKMRVKDSRR